MTHVLARSQIALIAAGLLIATPGVGFSQTAVPAREGNIWGGFDHQPQQAQVARAERAAGVAASRTQENAASQEVDDLYRYLLQSPSPHAG